MRPDDLAAVAERLLAWPPAEGGPPLRHHLCEFLDAFYEAAPEARGAMLAREPPPTGHAGEDAYLGGVAEHLALLWDAPVPPWADDAARRVSREPHYVGGPHGALLSRALLAESPVAFRKRFVFTEADPLRRASRRGAPPGWDRPNLRFDPDPAVGTSAATPPG